MLYECVYCTWFSFIFISNVKFSGTAFSISLFSNYMKLDDTLLGIISNMSKIVAAFAYAFARTDFEIYMGNINLLHIKRNKNSIVTFSMHILFHIKSSLFKTQITQSESLL